MSALQIDVDISLSVSDGRRRFDLSTRFASAAPVVALYGPSGAGKSITLQAMAGLLSPQSGHVRLAGQTLYNSAQGVNLPAEQRGVGYLFQHYALFPHLTVRQNVAFGLTSWWRRLSAADGLQVDELLEAFGLAALARSRPDTLSGGQQQRVALARALASRPRVLLLDEPFAALHPQLRHELRDELQAVIARWRIPAVLITHDIEDVLALANVAFLIDGGRVVREVDLDRAQSRSLAASTQNAMPTRQPRPQEDRLRVLLSGADVSTDGPVARTSSHG